MSSAQLTVNQPLLAAVSRYRSFGLLVKRMGLIGPDDPVFSDPHAEDLRGRHIVTDAIDLRLAAYATVVTVIPLAIPCDFDSNNAPIEILAQFAGEPVSFKVRGSSAFTIHQHNGGVTPGSTHAAAEILKTLKNDKISTEELASKLDELFYDERRAGLETENFLFRLMNLAHARSRLVAAL